MSFVAKEVDFLTFDIHGTACGMDILDVQEIYRVSEITEVPRSPEFVEGIINLRGNIFIIINMGKKLGLMPVERKKENRVIILNVEGAHVGLMVDDVDTVIRSDADNLIPVPGNLTGVEGSLFKGVVKSKDKLVGILETRKIL